MNSVMSSFRKYWALLLILLYILLNLATLTRFPLMHSDESWLSGLSRHILITGDYAAIEPFFDLKPRNPHALKIIFHSLQMLVIKLFGYNLFNMRLLSLVFGLATLCFFYRLCRLVLPAPKWARWACLLMGTDIQFIYASHFGRQEIILLWVMVFGLHYHFNNLNSHRYRHDLILGVLAGLSIGIHPNALIILLAFGGIYLTHLFQKRINFRSLSILGLSFTIPVLFFILLSFQLDPNFLSNYFTYGQEQFKIFSPFSARLSKLATFLKAIYLRQGGTYYLPDLKAQSLLITIIVLLDLTNFWRNRKEGRKSAPSWLIVSFITIIVGLVVIGRYNPTSVVFFTPLIYLLIGFSLAKIPEQCDKIIPQLLALAIFASTLLNIYPYLKYDYDSYLKEITAVVGPGRKVLASMNAEYAFEDGNLFDLRNLSFLKRRGLSFAEYIDQNRIEYLIYPEGLDFIYQTRPKWNGVYGHLPYYPELKQFIKEKCKLINSFAAPAYGIEIPAHIGRKNWQISIYQVDYDSTLSKN
jgi:4-amino-4-deoxy-L-arabinose transferase-like glycosyltransferase